MSTVEQPLGVKITVFYWRGTTRCQGIATTYRGAMRIASRNQRGAMRIASRNQNACMPTFFIGNRQLYDDGNGLAYEDSIDSGELSYAC